MFKPFVLVFISVCICISAIVAAPTADQNDSNSNNTITTTTTQETTTTLGINHSIKKLEEAGSSHSLSKEKTVANFAQYNNKLLVNQSNEALSSMNGRIISQQTTSNNNNNVTAVATNGLSLTVVLVLIAAITMLVSGIILSALFVMRRRFSIWRLNGDQESKEIPETSPENQPTETNKEAINESVKDELKCEEVNEKDPELAKQVSTLSAVAAVTTTIAVDTPVNINCENGHSNEAATDLCANEKLSNDQQQASPSSSSPLIEKAADEPLPTPNTDEHQPELKEQVTSSSSLIVNVLNELSESVACKLASPNSPAQKSVDIENTAETQPLNKEE